MWSLKPPPALLGAARSGRLALILGQGTNLGWSDEDPSASLPGHNALRDALASEFFEGRRRFDPLEVLVDSVLDAHGAAALRRWLEGVLSAYSSRAGRRVEKIQRWTAPTATGQSVVDASLTEQTTTR